MLRLICTAALSVVVLLPAYSQQPLVSGADVHARTPDKAWIEVSDGYTRKLLAISLKYGPEGGSAQGIATFDPLISNPTLVEERAQRKETEAELAKIKAAMANEKDKNVLEDMAIVQKAFNLSFRQQDYGEAHEVPFINASAAVFGGLQTLLDVQVADERRPAAVIRLRKYAGVEPGYKPFTDLLKQRELEQMAKPNMVYPSRGEMETELSRNSNYLDGLTMLFTKYKLTGWQEPLARLKTELLAYDGWVRANLLPKARTDFRLPAEDYALSLEGYGVDIPPTQLAAMAHTAFADYQAQMNVLAVQIAKTHNFP